LPCLSVERSQLLRNRWHDTLVSNDDPTTALAGKWTTDEREVEDAKREHSGKELEAIAARWSDDPISVLRWNAVYDI
jgi:hypothetical protein